MDTICIPNARPLRYLFHNLEMQEPLFDDIHHLWVLTAEGWPFCHTLEVFCCVPNSSEALNGIGW